jgi:hypothetical protein
MQTAELVAGRELDAAVAEALGFRTVAWHGDVAIQGEHENYVHALPYYSTNIADAWQVLEKLAGLQPRISIGVDFACCELIGAQVLADTAPLAICRAALAAVGH